MRAYRLIAKLCGVILLLIVSLGILGISQMLAISDTNSEYTRIMQEEVARLQALRSLTAGFFQVNRACLNALIQLEPESAATSAQSATKQLEALSPQLEVLGVAAFADAVTFQELQALTASYAGEVAAFFKLLEEGREADAKEFRLQQLRPRLEQINELLGEIASDSNAFVGARIQNMNQTSQMVGTVALIFSFWPFVVIIVALVWTAIVSLRYLASADTSSEIPVR